MIPIDTTEYHQFYHLPRFAQRRIQVQDVHDYILTKCIGEQWKVEKAGCSLQERPIYQIRYGHGPTKILLWSQMHGNEATATRAILELFQFLNSPTASKNWAKQLSIYFLPLLNPDGAAAHIRENAAWIDLNRDALALSAPESLILHKAIHHLQPDFCFNLHDQQIYYGIGNPCKQAAISLLAPLTNPLGTMSPSRQKAAKMVVLMEKWLRSEYHLPVGKWADEYEKRAFGEYCQAVGSSTILVEAGGLPRDWEKVKLTQYYFSLLLFSIQAIIDQDYEKETLVEYEAIPLNRLGVFDLIIRNVERKIGNSTGKVDIGIRREDCPIADGKSIVQMGKIIEIGDLSHATGIEEWDAAGADIASPKIYPETFPSVPPVDRAIEIMNQGYGAIQVKNISNFPDYVHFPLLIEESMQNPVVSRFATGATANFCLVKKDKMAANVINGYLHLINFK